MKTPLLLLAGLLISAASFAQSLEQTFRNLMADFKQNPYAYAQANYAPDFRFIAGNNGGFRTKDQLIGQNTKVEDIQATDLKFYESGDLAVVSGINTTRYASASGGQSATYKDAFTYTFRKMDGRWKHVAMQHTKIDYNAPDQATADEAAIKKTIEGVTTSMYARDFKTYLNYWANAPYVSRVSTDKEGKVTKMTGDDYRKMVEQWATQNHAPSQEKATRDNWQIRVNGNSAFVVFDQYNQYPDSTTRHSVEERYLERTNGEWKLVNVTVLVTK